MATTSLQVSLAPAQRPRDADLAPAQPLCDARGARVILGGSQDAEALAVPVAPSARTLFGPRGACVAGDGSLWVADTGHHRLLGWPRVPDRDGEPAAILIGQPSFAHEGRNGKGAVAANTCNVPTGVCACGKGLALADAWNHRVLIWHALPIRNNQPADVVLGQVNFSSAEANRGHEHPTAASLFWPYGVAWDGESLWVADTGNRRVLQWQGLPPVNGTPAAWVLGQADFRTRDENGGGDVTAASMRWPHAIAFPGNGLCVADAGNNRIMVWHAPPAQDNQPCDAVLGQTTMTAADHNRGQYWPDASALNLPYGVAACGDLLVVADTANSRLLAWPGLALPTSGMPADALAAQPDWNAKGDNRWQPPARDSVCWPYSVWLGERQMLIADAGNNRVLIWDLSEEARAWTH